MDNNVEKCCTAALAVYLLLFSASYYLGNAIGRQIVDVTEQFLKGYVKQTGEIKASKNQRVMGGESGRETANNGNLTCARCDASKN